MLVIRIFKCRIVLFTLGCLLSLQISAQDTTQYRVKGRSNSPSQYQKSYIILVSADGFRHDFAEKYNAAFLNEMSAGGVKATSMKPSYPSLTFPNHYSIATGLYPAHHGLVDNNMYDRKTNQFSSIRNRKAVTYPAWYGGTPIWVLAENNRLMSASFYWVGSETEIKGVRPSYYFNYNEAIPIDRRIEIVKEWLEMPDSTRPHLITFYMPEVDHAAHRFGTNAPETREAVQFVDEAMKKLYQMTQDSGLPVNFIFLSDHGMADMDTDNPIKTPVKIDTAKFIVTGGATTVHLYAKEKRDVKPLYKLLKKNAQEYHAYLVKKTPKKWHYRTSDDRFERIGDILLTPVAPPKGFGSPGKKLSKGEHGFDNALPEMQATFYAWGPAFKEHYTIGNFENVHVYPLIAKILGLPITEKNDGNLKALQSILK